MKRSGIPMLLTVLAWSSVVLGAIAAMVLVGSVHDPLAAFYVVAGVVPSFALLRAIAVIIEELEDIRAATQRAARAAEERAERAA